MVHDSEVQWMLRQRPLVHDPEQLHVDYGEEAVRIVAAFQEHGWEPYLPLLAWPGIATRWQDLLSWLDARGASGDPQEVFFSFAQYLGRVTTYRALALTPEEYAVIREADSILPTGRLKTDAVTLARFVREQGVRKILQTRMCNIGALPYDPSLSLHDHPETAVCIAAGYMQIPERQVYRLELDVPMIEVVGWRMCEVDGWEGWFEHHGIWFDTTNPRTERFVLYEIPYFSKRCKSVRTFSSRDEIHEYLRPFAAEQTQRRAAARPPESYVREPCQSGRRRPSHDSRP